LRRASRALRGRESFYYFQQSLQSSQLIAYHRHAPTDPSGPEEYAMVILNFGTTAGTIDVPFPKAGVWTERLDASFRTAPLTVTITSAGDAQSITVPSNYGYIFIL
jgi:hypothetical protein